MPVREDPALAAALAAMALGQEVPEELWMAVAEVLVWAYGLEQEGEYPEPVMWVRTLGPIPPLHAGSAPRL